MTFSRHSARNQRSHEHCLQSIRLLGRRHFDSNPHVDGDEIRTAPHSRRTHLFPCLIPSTCLDCLVGGFWLDWPGNLDTFVKRLSSQPWRNLSSFLSSRRLQPSLHSLVNLQSRSGCHDGSSISDVRQPRAMSAARVRPGMSGDTKPETYSRAGSDQERKGQATQLQ